MTNGSFLKDECDNIKWITMQNKLQELTDRVFNEGVQKAKAEASVIVANARREADTMLQEAQRKAEAIVAEAQRKAKETSANARSEIRMASVQAVGMLKSQIESLITAKAVEPAVGELFADADFVRQLLLTTVRAYVDKGETDLTVILPKGELERLETAVAKSFADIMNKGLTVCESDAVRNGFRIEPKDGGYYISFGESEFANFFKAYVRSKTAEMLFD